jgi:hypothetical protein
MARTDDERKTRLRPTKASASTDGQVYHIYRTPEMEELRSRRGLQSNSFIRLRKLSTVRGPVVEIKDMGDSEDFLTNEAHLRETQRNGTTRCLA